jgi:hypothetical protein
VETRVPLVQIDIGLLADQVRVSATDTLDLGQGIHNLLLSVNIGVEKTENLPIVNICFFEVSFLIIDFGARNAEQNGTSAFERSGDGVEFDIDEMMLERMTYELEVRLLSRDERHDGQLLPVSCRMLVEFDDRV